MVPSGFRRCGYLCFINQFSKKMTSAGLSSLRVSDISENLDFWWSIPQKGTGIGHLGARDDQIIKISNFFLMKWGCWGHWGCWCCWGHWVWVLRPGKPLLRTSEPSRHLNSALFLYFEKKNLRRIMKYHIEFLHLFCQRLFRPAHVIFLKTGWWNTNVQSSWSH